MQSTKNLANKIEEVIKSDDLEKISKYLTSEPIQKVISTFIDMLSNESNDLDEDDIKLLGNIVRLANKVYNYSGYSTGISDSDYDMMYSFVDKNLPEYLSITESSDINDETVHHIYVSLRGTLDKIYKLTDDDVIKNKSQMTIDEWIKRTNNKLASAGRSDLDVNDCEVIVMPKYDGVSCEFEYDKNGNLLRALTRGDTTKNETKDVTKLFLDKMSRGIFNASQYEYGVKTEVMMSEENFMKYNETYNKDYRSSRSIVSSLMNSDKIDERIDLITVFPLRYSYMIDEIESRQYLSPETFSFPYIKCKLSDREEIHKFAFEHKFIRYQKQTYRCDGAVIYICDENIQDILGRENNRQKYEVAFKYTEEVGYSEVVDIDWSVGMTGICTPVVRFKPITLKGNEVQKASLGSYARFKELALSKKDRIKVYYDVVPYVIFENDDKECVRSHKSIISRPVCCPDCLSALIESAEGTSLNCINKSCPSRVKGKIVNYCNRIGIEGLSFETVDLLYKEKYLRNIEDIYSLKAFSKELEKLPGLGKKSVDNIISSIDSHRTVTDVNFISSIGIKGIGQAKITPILKFFNLKEVIDYSLDNNFVVFTVCDGFGEKTAKALVEGIQLNINTINVLLNELNIEKATDSNARYYVITTKLYDADLNPYRDLIDETNGCVSDNLLKSKAYNSIVVCPNKYTTSEKVNKANKWNIPIVPINELEKYIEDNFR